MSKEEFLNRLKELDITYYCVHDYVQIAIGCLPAYEYTFVLDYAYDFAKRWEYPSHTAINIYFHEITIV